MTTDSEIARLTLERDELRREVAILRPTVEHMDEVTSKWSQAVDQAERERDEARRERERLRKAITDCLDYANGRQYEWGSRAEAAFEILDAAIDEAMRGGK